MPELDSNPQETPLIVDSRSSYQMNWEDLPESRREKLVEIYGEPITIPGASFEIRDREVAGTCPANETSLAAIDKDRMYWGHYAMAVVNNSMIVYWLEMKPRIISSKIIKGSKGGMILPGMIYTESGYTQEGVSLIQDQVMENGTIHVAPQGQRGDFTTLHLSDKPAKYVLTQLREYQSGPVHSRNIDSYIDDNTVHNIVQKAQLLSMENEDELYSNLQRDITTYFVDPENPELVKEIKLTAPITPNGEIGLPLDDALKNMKSSSLHFRPGEKFKAIKDPISWNNHGQDVYIMDAGGKYYFCPADCCEVISK